MMVAHAMEGTEHIMEVVVHLTGFEPAHLAILDPKSNVAANFTIDANIEHD